MVRKGSEYNEKRSKMLFWGYAFVGVALLTFVVFVARIIILQNTNVEEYKDNIINKNYRETTLKAARGNLFASDGSILATTVMRYDIYLDFKTMRDTIYKNNAGKLSDSLGAMFGKPASYFRQRLDQQKKSENQYYPLAKGLDFDQYDRIRKFPIFNRGKNKGGFIVDREYRREIATAQIGSGTIGMDRDGAKSGFEGAFSKFLTGTDGTRLEQRINSTQWKPIDFWKVKEPVNGMDVYTTLDLRVQDIAHSALEKQLVEFDADHGSVIVMETETGKVRAMVNLRRTEPGIYVDAYNYAIKDATEPGSIWKTVTLLAAMDDGFVDENTKINIGGIEWTYAGQRITDSHSGGVYDISDIMAQSSNIGAAKVITSHYADNPQILFDHLKKWKLYEKMNIELPGVTRPRVLTPANKRWSKGALASIAFGYGVNVNQLQLTTFYNGVANKGKMVKPLFIDKIMKEGKVIYEAKPEIMVQKMASDKAIEMMTHSLTKAVEKGTAKSIYTPNLKIAGKTGTARFEYWKPGPMKYIASFAGYFPADNPKYTCIVVINQPDNSKGFYGARVAAPAFKEIAGKIFLKTPLNVNKEMLVNKKVDMSRMIEPTRKVSVDSNKMPNLVGLMGRNVIPQLENLGYRVEYKGAGKVLEQFPAEGTKINGNQKIYLSLQN